MIHGNIGIRIGLKGKVLITIVGHLLLLATILTIFHILRQWESVSQDRRTRGWLMASMMTDIARLPLMETDSVALSALVESVRDRPEVLYSGIIDNDGKLLHHANRLEIVDYLDDLNLPDRDHPKMTVSVEKLTAGALPVFHVVSPVSMIRGQDRSYDSRSTYHGRQLLLDPDNIIGYVFLGVSASGLLSTIWHELIISSGITLLFSGLAILVATVFSQLLIDPLIELLRASQLIAQGDLHIRIPALTDDEIGDLCTAFNRMAERLELTHQNLQDKTSNLQRANADLESFVFSVSHDLKAPLISLSSYSKYLKEEFGDQLDETAQTYINRIYTNTEKMSLLIRALLEISRIGRIQESFSTIDVQSLVKEALLQFRSRIEELRGSIAVSSGLPTIYYQRTHMYQILSNLLENAIKYSDPRRPPEIKIDCQENAGWYCFSVRDNGIGISKEYRERIFGMFQRLHSNAHIEGTGMGLAIVKKIVETYGGRIWIESNEPFGCIVNFTIPIHRQKEESE